MSKILIVGCADDMPALTRLEDAEFLTVEEAERRGLTLMPFTQAYEASMRVPPVRVIPEADPLPFHGYRGKRRGRRQY